MRFTNEELAIAKSVDLVAVASSLGYTPRKIGKYFTLKEMDSIRIYNRRNWYRWSRKGDKGHDGGSQIDFLREFAGLDVKSAVAWLLNFTGYIKTDTKSVNIKKNLKNQIDEKPIEEKKTFVLPKANRDNKLIYQYLSTTRGISISVIDYFIKKGLIYEDEKYHNVVFKGNDKDGITHIASMRGIYDRDGKRFRCDVAGSDKNYGFNVYSEECDEVYVFEAAIDLMSYMDISGEMDGNYISLGMLGDAPLETFLEEHPDICTIRLCLDGDEPGISTMKQLEEKYIARGYDVSVQPPPAGYKDYNEWLVAAKLSIGDRACITDRRR